jgi:hypothetical protein
LEQDFEPNSRPKSPGDYRLLILDGHNSHCTYQFIKFSAEHHIIIICLPSHTTHALQPCDVGIFGPLARAWKSCVTRASQENIPITKSNLLRYYHEARNTALKTTTIQSAFRKTGIHPLDRNAVPLSAFEPAKNTTTQAAQPLPAELSSLLIPTPAPSPAVSAAPAAPSPAVSALTPPVDHSSRGPNADPTSSAAEPEPRQRYHVKVPPSLPNSASHRALQEENQMLRGIIEQAGVVLEQDYAQMKLMDMENERLRQKAFMKCQQKAAKKLTSGQARHMTAPEMMDLLARQAWESAMRDLFKEASERFKAQRKAIDDYHKQIAANRKAEEKAQKVAEHQAKKAEKEAEKARALAERMATRGHGRGRGRARGRGRGRGVDEGAATLIAQGSDISSYEEQLSDSDLARTDDNDVPETSVTRENTRLLRACRKRAPRFLPEGDDEEDEVPPIARPQPRPRPRRVILIVRPPVVPPSADTSNQALDDTTPSSQLPQEHCDLTTRIAITSVGNAEEATTTTLPSTSQPIPCLAPKGDSTAAQDEAIQSDNTEVGSSRSILECEPSTQLGEGADVAAKGLLTRRSTRIAVRRK